MLENLFTPKYSEQWYLNLSPAKFFEPRQRDGGFIAPFSDPELKALGPERRQEIAASKLGMNRAQFMVLDGSQLSALILNARGKTYSSGASEVAEAAQKDVRNASIYGFVKGLGSAGTLVAVAGLVLTVYLNRKQLFPSVK